MRLCSADPSDVLQPFAQQPGNGPPVSRPQNDAKTHHAVRAGAGVVLIEYCTTPASEGGTGQEQGTAKQGPAFILFKVDGAYSDAGGLIDPGEDPLTSAQRELTEESCGLFRLDLLWVPKYCMLVLHV